MQTIEQGSARGEFNLSPDRMKTQEILSDMIIPAVRGEYYAYSSEFTDEKPLYVFMKCKANKARTIASAEYLGREANLLFRFDSVVRAHVYAIKTAHACGLLGDTINGELFGETWVSPAGIAPDHFYDIRSRKDVTVLVKVCKAVCSKHMVYADLEPGIVIAMMTDSGKYGMFLVKELTPTSVNIDACHILL